ncbi:MAG: peptide chain release factor N(5)-glutamine methyltransferase, partial [Rhodobacteraceae bacterium]|nr:peptide chain release factor N(5)-glutamine methyltransferase [Paracoccaceae bacterium]
MPATHSITVSQAVADLAARFQDAGIESARLDARVLVGHIVGYDANRLLNIPDQVLSDADNTRLEQLSIRRIAREPVSRIIGLREFWGLEFSLSPETLDPRPDTETLVQAVLDRRSRFSAREGLRILDLGTGTGCLLLALLSEIETATGLGVDISSGAIDCARKNAADLGLDDRAAF